MHKLWSIQTMECYSTLKTKEYQAMKTHGGTLRASYPVKEKTHLKRLCTVGFHISDVLERQNDEDSKKWLPGSGMGVP